MSYVFIADLHCRLTGFNNLVDGLPENIYYPLYNLELAAKKAKENDSILVILGDLIHEKKNINQLVLKKVCNMIEYITEDLKVETVIISGNHDYTEYNNESITWLEQLRFSNLTVLMPGQQEISGRVLFIPNSPINSMNEALSNEYDEDTILVSHFGLYEAQLSGTEYKTGEFRLSQLKRFKRVILGHYHKPQEVGNVIYIGSPTPVSVAEFPERKHFMTYDTISDKVEYIDTVYPKTHTIDVASLDKEIDFTEIKKNVELGDKYYIKTTNDFDNIQSLKKMEKEYPDFIKVKIVKENKTEEKHETLSTINYDLIFSQIAKEAGIKMSNVNLFKILAKDLVGKDVKQN